MALDFNTLFNDPQLQYGLALMDSSHTSSPFTGAAQALMGLQKNQREQQQQALREQEFEQTKQLQAVQMQRMTAQSQMEQQQMAIAKQQFDQQQAFYEALKKSPQFAAMLGQQQMQQPSMQPQGDVAPSPPSPTLQPMSYQGGGQGAPQGPGINPNGSLVPTLGTVPHDWQSAADQQVEFDAVAHGNMQQVAGGGRMPLAALAPQGMPQVQAPMSQAAPGGNPGLDLATMGALGGLAGIKGGQGLIDVGKMMQPQNVPGGSYMRGPDGQMTFVPDPYKQQQIGQEQQKIGIQQQELGLKQSDQTYKQQQANAGLPQEALNSLQSERLKSADQEIEKSYQLNKAMPNQLMAIKRAQADIVNNPYVGTGAGFKTAVVKAYTNLFPGIPLDPNIAKAEDFDAAMSIQWMKAAKKVDPNISDKGIDAIRAAFGSRANDPNALKRILQETYDSMNQDRIAHNNAVKQFNTKVGDSPYNRMIPETLPSPKANAALQANPTPQMRQFFDQKYGEGSAARTLGQ